MSRPAISESLQAAIEQLRPELPTLLGADCTTFVAQLEDLLSGESESQVWELFEKHPTITEHLQDILEQQEDEEDIIRGGSGIYGDPQPSTIVKHASLLYRCDKGLHTVAADHVEERDAVGNALCPQHGVPMVKIVKKRNERNQKQV